MIQKPLLFNFPRRYFITWHRLNESLFYIFFTITTFALFAGFTLSFHWLTLLSSLAYSLPAGLLFAIQDIYMSENRSTYRHPSYLSFIILIGARICVALILIFVGINKLAVWFGLSGSNAFFFDDGHFFYGSVLVKLIYLSMILLIILSIYSVVSRKFGSGLLWNLLTGYYHKPRKETRIFMFVDVKNSTGMGETLEPRQYSELLQEFFFDIGDVIHIYRGTIYQHVGDEVVITWHINSKRGKPDDFIRCFFAMKLRIKRREKKYMDRFGLVPDFRAGIHCGEVVTSEVGKYKVEIAYHGDVVNTTARIVDACKKLEYEVLLSDDAATLLRNDENYILETLGIRKLKGKKRKKELYSVRQKGKRELPEVSPLV